MPIDRNNTRHVNSFVIPSHPQTLFENKLSYIRAKLLNVQEDRKHYNTQWTAGSYNKTTILHSVEKYSNEKKTNKMHVHIIYFVDSTTF